MSAHLGAETHECETAGREEGCRKCDNSMCHYVVVTPQLSVWKAASVTNEANTFCVLPKQDEREAQRTQVKNAALKCNWINPACHPLLPSEALPHLSGLDFTFKLSYQSNSSRFHMYEMQIKKRKNRWQEKGAGECEAPLLLLSIMMLILTRWCLLDWLLGSNPIFLFLMRKRKS